MAAITTGNEPQIGGLPPSNAPMISSIHTRAIADARGAHLAGNFEALVEVMNEGQRRRLRQAMLRQALWHAEKVLSPSAVHGLRSSVEVVRRWLIVPGPDDDPPLFNPFAEPWLSMHLPPELVQSFASDHLPPEAPLLVIYEATWCMIASRVSRAAEAAIRIAGEAAALKHRRSEEWYAAKSAKRRAKSAARQWQVDAAWAILAGRTLPSLD